RDRAGLPAERDRPARDGDPAAGDHLVRRVLGGVAAAGRERQAPRPVQEARRLPGDGRRERRRGEPAAGRRRRDERERPGRDGELHAAPVARHGANGFTTPRIAGWSSGWWRRRSDRIELPSTQSIPSWV